MRKINKQGFTLIELLVVITIIGLLSSIVLVSLSTVRAKGRDTRRVSDIRELQLALEMYYDSNRAYPATLASLAPTYIPRIPTDPLKNTINYNYAPCSTSGKVTGYHLGASLEDIGNVALTADSDAAADTTNCTAGDFDGTDKGTRDSTVTTSCTGLSNPKATETCYDIKR